MNTITIYVTERKRPFYSDQTECEYYPNHTKSPDLTSVPLDYCQDGNTKAARGIQSNFKQLSDNQMYFVLWSALTLFMLTQLYK